MSLLAHTVWGEGPPLLLLHGFTGSREAWDHLRPLLGPRFQVLAPDLPGHGESAIDPDTTFDGALDALIGLLDSRKIERVDVAGYSLGARVALGLCLRAPERVGRLVLESGSPGLRRSCRSSRACGDCPMPCACRSTSGGCRIAPRRSRARSARSRSEPSPATGRGSGRSARRRYCSPEHATRSSPASPGPWRRRSRWSGAMSSTVQGTRRIWNRRRSTPAR